MGYVSAKFGYEDSDFFDNEMIDRTKCIKPCSLLSALSLLPINSSKNHRLRL